MAQKGFEDIHVKTQQTLDINRAGYTLGDKFFEIIKEKSKELGFENDPTSEYLLRLRTVNFIFMNVYKPMEVAIDKAEQSVPKINT